MSLAPEAEYLHRFGKGTANNEPERISQPLTAIFSSKEYIGESTAHANISIPVTYRNLGLHYLAGRATRDHFQSLKGLAQLFPHAALLRWWGPLPALTIYGSGIGGCEMVSVYSTAQRYWKCLTPNRADRNQRRVLPLLTDPRHMTGKINEDWASMNERAIKAQTP